MLSSEAIRLFSIGWVKAINERDGCFFDKYFDDEVTLSSIFLVNVIPESQGILSGKQRILNYLEMVFIVAPERKFDLLSYQTQGSQLIFMVQDLSTNEHGVISFVFNTEGKVQKIKAAI